MAYIAAADFRERTIKHYCVNLVLGEEFTDPYLDSVIAQMTAQVELDRDELGVESEEVLGIPG